MLRVRGESGAGRGRGKHTTHPDKRHTSHCQWESGCDSAIVVSPSFVSRCLSMLLYIKNRFLIAPVAGWRRRTPEFVPDRSFPLSRQTRDTSSRTPRMWGGAPESRSRTQRPTTQQGGLPANGRRRRRAAAPRGGGGRGVWWRGGVRLEEGGRGGLGRAMQAGSGGEGWGMDAPWTLLR